MAYEVKCGKCGCEYNGRVDKSTTVLSGKDYSCPVCGFDGRIQENQKAQPKLLKDNKNVWTKN